MNFDKVLQVAVRGGASDIILKAGSIPKFRYNGELVPLSGATALTPDVLNSWLERIVPAHLKSALTRLEDLDFALQSDAGMRFRVNLFRQRQTYALVLRVVPNHTRTLEELQLPKVLHTFCGEKRGIVLVTGSTGSGKSTTVAAMIEKINATRAAHVITIEDPIEFIFRDKKSTIEQREIGIDTPNFGSALRSALRQNPDVIFVGELRDKETTETALMAAETGHFVLSTLHTVDAAETLTRVLSYFPAERHETLRLTLASTLRAVVSQRLVVRADDKGMVAALEVLVSNELVRDHLRHGSELKAVKDAIAKSQDTYGMQSFDQSLIELVHKGLISKEEALRQATNGKDLELQLRGIGR